MILGILIGAVLMYLLLFVIGRIQMNKAIMKGYDAYIKCVKDGRLVITEWMTIEDVFYVLLKLVKDKKQYDFAWINFEVSKKKVV